MLVRQNNFVLPVEEGISLPARLPFALLESPRYVGVSVGILPQSRAKLLFFLFLAGLKISKLFCLKNLQEFGCFILWKKWVKYESEMQRGTNTQ